MSIEYKGKMSIIIFVILLASIIPYCMISSYRESIVQNRINELSIVRQEHALGLNKIFESTTSSQHIAIDKGEQRE